MDDTIIIKKIKKKRMKFRNLFVGYMSMIDTKRISLFYLKYTIIPIMFFVYAYQGWTWEVSVIAVAMHLIWLMAFISNIIERYAPKVSKQSITKNDIEDFKKKQLIKNRKRKIRKIKKL